MSVRMDEEGNPIAPKMLGREPAQKTSKWKQLRSATARNLLVLAGAGGGGFAADTEDDDKQNTGTINHPDPANTRIVKQGVLTKYPASGRTLFKKKKERLIVVLDSVVEWHDCRGPSNSREGLFVPERLGGEWPDPKGSISLLGAKCAMEISKADRTVVITPGERRHAEWASSVRHSSPSAGPEGTV